MIIKKVLNTNAVLATSPEHADILLLGNGIGFKKHAGSTVDENAIEKQFILTDKAQTSRFAELIDSIPNRFFIVTEEIIEYAKKEYPKLKLNSNVLFTLVDHIYNAVTSAEKGIFVPNTMLTDIQRFYADEYAIGEFGINVIYRNFGVQLKKDEAGFIAMHFVMAGTSNAKSDITRMLEIIHELDSLITQELSLDVDASSLTYFRYMTHLKFFAERVIKNVHYKEDKGTEVLKVMTKEFPVEYNCARKICRYVEENYNYHAGQEEEIYLAVHLARLDKKGL